jgi:hypothetical protein
MSIKELTNFIYSESPTYDNGDLKIIFSHCKYPLINIKHEGWIFPSMYEDSPLEKGYGEINSHCANKLIIDFESFEFPKRIYLSLEVMSKDEIKVRYDDYCRAGMILKRTF